MVEAAARVGGVGCWGHHLTGWRGVRFEAGQRWSHGWETAAQCRRHVIPGWTDALQTMAEGQTNRLWIPKELAYEGKPGRPQGMLVFDVELLKIVSGGKKPPPMQQAK